MSELGWGQRELWDHQVGEAGPCARCGLPTLGQDHCLVLSFESLQGMEHGLALGTHSAVTAVTVATPASSSDECAPWTHWTHCKHSTPGKARP